MADKSESGKTDHGPFSTVGSNAARYKSMSPAKLPISRTTCLTIPPGLSPTSLLESPVLLSNIKAEPSPTTGTFSMPLIMHDAVGSDTFSSPRDTTNNSTCDEGSSGEFEFKPHTRSGSGSNLSSLGHLASAASNYQQCKPFVQAQGQHQSQTFSSPPVLMKDVEGSSHDLTLSVTASNVPAYTAILRNTAPTEVASDESQQRHDSERGTQALQSDHKGPSPLVTNEKSSEDGYNWRKYGHCRKWKKGGFTLKSFTGVVWEIPRWTAPPRPKPETKSEDPASGESGKENKDNSQLESEKSNNGIDVDIASAPSQAVGSSRAPSVPLESSPAAAVIVATPA